MPPSQLEYRDTELFPAMDQNLPEGYLFQRLREAFPKQPLTPMHLLALMGENGIGWLGFALPDATAAAPVPTLDREALLHAPADARLFDELVRAYLSTGIGISGLQPKIMVPERATFPVPNLIVKSPHCKACGCAICCRIANTRAATRLSPRCSSFWGLARTR